MGNGRMKICLSEQNDRVIKNLTLYYLSEKLTVTTEQMIILHLVFIQFLTTCMYKNCRTEGEGDVHDDHDQRIEDGGWDISFVRWFSQMLKNILLVPKSHKNGTECDRRSTENTEHRASNKDGVEFRSCSQSYGVIHNLESPNGL